MSRMSRLVFGFIVMMTVWSCSNEFDLVEGEVKVPVVYGILDVSDEAHYIRVEKAFVDPKISATILAKDPNQLYYDDAVVKIVRRDTTYENNNRDTIVNKTEYILTKVDGNLEGLQREEGAFATAPNYLYKITSDEINLEEEKTYSLEIEIPGEETVIANTIILEKTISQKPKFDPTKTATLDFPFGRTTNLSWISNRGAAIYSCKIVIHYSEEIDNVVTEKTLDWNIFDNITLVRYELNGSEFYSFMKGNIEVIPNAKRKFLKMEYILTSGGKEIEDYLKVAQANLGITSSGEIPNYSNLSRGRGIFSSRSKVVIEEVELSGTSSVELAENPLTAPLNF